jgi:membrane protease YdiL (CAAX protease family)
VASRVGGCDDATRMPMHRDLAHASLAFAAVGIAVALLVRIDVQLPFVGHVGSALVAMLLLYAPLFAAWRRGEELHDYGFHLAPIGRGLAVGLGVPLLVFPLFALGYVAFHEVTCATPSLRFLTPPGTCVHWAASRGGGLDWGALAELAAVQLVVVALPEELFFRGFLLELLERAWPPRRRFLGGGLGRALLLSSLMFALIHVPREGDLRTLATFFPGLLFGWMRSATGSILAPVLAHASSNVFIRALDQMVQMVPR